ncbi:MAG: ArsR/SmtB family transcription factor [Candidatus Hodarchaeales archaeon]|jgi:DNA-binding transcriptional ArsR family regulator
MAKNCEETVIHPENVSVAKEKLEKGNPTKLASFFKLLAGETRMKILLALSEVELCVCDISTLLNIEQSAISHQLTKLKHQNLVRPRREGKQVFYSLEKEHVDPIIAQTLEHVMEEAN